MPQTTFPPLLPLGKVVVTTAGTPVGLLDAFVYPPAGGAAGGLKASGQNGQKIRVASIYFAVINGLNVNTGFIYIGVKGMNKATGVGVIHAIPVAAVGVTNWFTLPAQGWGGGNELTPEDIFLDADTNGNSVQVTATQY
jgi:hypothetical protein